MSVHTLEDFGQPHEDEETCPNGEPLEFCEGPETDELGCYECFKEGLD